MTCEIKEFTGYTCEEAAQCAGGAAGGDEWFNSCRNPLYAFEHQDTCGTLVISSLAATPAEQTLSLGRSGYVQAIVTFDDGRSADVTGEASFASSDSGIVVSLGGGLFEGVAAGTAIVTAIWGGKTAMATLNVTAAGCVDDQPWDVVVVADDGDVWIDGGRYIPGIGGSTRVRAFRRAASTAATAYPADILQLMLSMDLLDSGEITAADGFALGGWNPIAYPSGIGGTRTGSDRIWTGTEWTNQVTMAPCFINAQGDTGRKLADAAQILIGSGRPGARKLVVLYSTGGETTCNPGLTAAGNVLHANGILLAVVTPLTESDSNVVSPCEQIPAYAVLGALPSTPCLFFGGGDSGAGVFASMLSTVCGGCSSGDGIGVDQL